jgi:hypothetical protein
MALLFVSPFMFPPIIRMIRAPLGSQFADRARALGLSVFAVSTLTMFGLSLFVEVFFYWNIIAFLLLMPLVAAWFGRRWLVNAYYTYGVVGAVLLTVNFALVPLGNVVGAYDWTVSSSYGWQTVAARVETLKQERDIGLVIAARYTTAAQLGYAMHDPEVVTIANRHDQYDYWFDPSAHLGEDALIVSDPMLGLGEIAPYFDRITPIETIDYQRFGIPIYSPTIYLGSGLRLP